MKLSKLYIKDFLCYDYAYIDFTQFSSALIVGKSELNEQESNGVGKTTIFRAIEYVLFNYSDIILENIVRDDAPLCQIVLDFEANNQIYRLSRTRTKKGIADLSLYEKISDDLDDSVFHNAKFEPQFEKKDWKDISQKRAGDTEKDLSKILKINLKSFRTFVHFVQHDFSGIATATPEKRKAILRDALNLVIYPKLEKIAKEKLATFQREADRCRGVIEQLGDPLPEIYKAEKEIIKNTNQLQQTNELVIDLQNQTNNHQDIINSLISNHNSLEAKFTSLLSQKNNLLTDQRKINSSLDDMKSKKDIVLQAAKNLTLEIKKLDEQQKLLSQKDYSQIDQLTTKIEENKIKLGEYGMEMKTLLANIEELKIPLPTGSVCKTCRKPMTDNERQECINKDHSTLTTHQNRVKELKLLTNNLNSSNQMDQQTILSLKNNKQSLDGLTNSITNKRAELQDKKARFDEYNKYIQDHTNNLKSKNEQLQIIENDLQNSPIEEAKNIKSQINDEQKQIYSITQQINKYGQEITTLNNQIAISNHTITQKKQDKQKQNDLTKCLLEVEDRLAIYPSVIQAFSSAGIPNLIIQNVLDDLQIEANILLSQLKPGLQLTFSIEKTKSDGVEAETLDIQYQVNGKKRYYEQLSGAMQLVVMFSLKLGLSFLLQKMLGINVQFLLLDEVDSPLDKVRSDIFADIVKYFSKDFTILVITHNDRLKSKFAHNILVEQDINLVSRAKVVSN